MKSYFLVLKSHLRLSSPLLHCIFLLILTYALYYQTFYNEWTIDDFPVLVQNPDIKSLSGFFNDTYPGRPLRELTFLLDFLFFGNNPFGYHFQHLFWHGLNAVLVYLLARKLFSGNLPAFFCAVLFLAHPLNVEVVANLSNRKDSLSLAFSLFSVSAFGWAYKSHKSRRFALFLVSVIFYIIACHAKQNALLVPLLWMAYEYRFVPEGKRLLARLPPIKSLMILLGLACSAYIAKLISLGGAGKLQQQAWVIINQNNYHPKPDLIEYVRLLLKAWGAMLSKILWPVNLGPEYAIPATDSFSDFQILLTIIIIITFTIALFHFGKKQSSNIFFALIWCLVFWLPVSNIWPAADLAADRYYYSIVPGFVILFVHTTLKPFAVYKRTYISIAVCICILMSALSFQQAKYWKNGIALWEHAVSVNPESSRANHNLGVILLLEGKPERSVKYFHKSVTLNPYFQGAYHNLARNYTQLGQRSLAQEAAEKSLRPPPWKSY